MKPKLPEQVRNKIRVRHYSVRTEKTYLWIESNDLFSFTIKEIPRRWERQKLKPF